LEGPINIFRAGVDLGELKKVTPGPDISLRVVGTWAVGALSDFPTLIFSELVPNPN
jgi:hypothetical protein